MFQKLLRIYSYLFAAAASLAYLALGVISKLTGSDLSLDNMPWKGPELTTWLLVLGVLGLLATVAAVFGGRLRFLLPIFLAIVVYLTIKGNFMGTHSFDGQSDFEKTIAVSAAAVIAFLAGLLQFRKQVAP